MSERSRTCILSEVSVYCIVLFFFFSSRRRHTRLQGDWSSDVCSSDLQEWMIHTHLNEFGWEHPASGHEMFREGRGGFRAAFVEAQERFVEDLRKIEEIGRASCRERV